MDEAPLFTAAMQFCAKRGSRVPEDVALACCDSDPNFSWCKPPVTHIHWDSRPVIRQAQRWASDVGRGQIDRRQTDTLAEFAEFAEFAGGGTIGPVRASRNPKPG